MCHWSTLYRYASEMIKRGAANLMVAGGAEAAICKLG